jgi:peptidyl-prolyl isomerase D
LHCDRSVQAADNCTRALEIEPANSKALFRRATALEKLKKYDEAERDIKAALEIDSSDKAIIQLRDRVAELKRRQVEKEKKMYGKMFG